MIIFPYCKVTNLDFINEKCAELEKNIVTLSKEHITDLVKEIFKLAKHEYFEIHTLNKLLARIQKKKEYYSNSPEQYEKLSFIEKKFQHKIHHVQKKLTIYRGLKNIWDKFDPLQVYTEGSTWTDEYDAYIFPIFKLLEKSIRFDELYQHIQFIVETRMGLKNYNQTKIADFVHELQNWHKNYKTKN